MLKPMNVIKVDARSNKNATFNEVMNKPLNNPDWIDSTESNRAFERVQQEIRNKGEYSIRPLPNLDAAPSISIFWTT